MTTLNHLPLFKSNLRSECKPLGGTADPHAAITCPHCRAMLASKVAAHTLTAEKSNASERQFFAADAAHWQAVLDGVALDRAT